MTRKDYVLIARTVQAMVLPDDHRLEVAHNLAMAFRSDNPRFDYERFMEACGARRI